MNLLRRYHTKSAVKLQSLKPWVHISQLKRAPLDSKNCALTGDLKLKLAYGSSSPEAYSILRWTALPRSWIKIFIPNMKSLFLCLSATFLFPLLMLGRQCPLTLSAIDAYAAKAIATQQSHKTISLRWFRYYNCYRLLVG